MEGICVHCSKEVENIVRYNNKTYCWECQARLWAKIIKEEILKRDNYTCQICGVKDGELEVHHKVSVKEGGTSNPNNLITLCFECHKKTHRLRNSLIRE